MRKRLFRWGKKGKFKLGRISWEVLRLVMGQTKWRNNLEYERNEPEGGIKTSLKQGKAFYLYVLWTNLAIKTITLVSSKIILTSH